VLVLLVVLAPHLGILLLSFAKVWSYSVLPDAFTLSHYATVFQESPRMIWNTALYCGIAATLDVVIATAIAYLMLRTKVPGRNALDFTVTIALAIPGVVLGIGYLRTFRGIEIPRDERARIIRRHCALIEAHLPPRLALVQLKKHLAWYAVERPGMARLRQQLFELADASAVLDLFWAGW